MEFDPMMIATMSDSDAETVSERPTACGKTLSVEQRDAVDKIKERLRDGKTKGQILLGGTGCGKTFTTVAALNEIVMDGPASIALCIVPSMGETVFQQWMAEIADYGCAERSMTYHGSKRRSQLEEFRKRFETSEDGLTWFIVTSIDTLHADVNNALQEMASKRAPSSSDTPEPRVAHAPCAIKKKRRAKIASFSAADVATARSKAVSAFGPIHYMVVDEFQDFRNGSPPTDSTRDIDSTKSLYVTLNAFHRTHKPIGTFGLTATPAQNTPGEVFSFLRFIINNKYSKENFVHGTKNKSVTTAVCKEFVVKLATPPVPETTHCTVSHSYCATEIEIHKEVYRVLFNATEMFYKAILAWMDRKNDQYLTSEKERTKKIFLKHFTRARRMAVHPALAAPPNRADPSVKPARNASGEIMYTTDQETGARVQLGAIIPPNISELVDTWPVRYCSKITAILDRLAEIHNERVVVQFQYSDPCDLLECYFKQRFPDREVYVYHGSRPRRAEVMNAFKTGAVNAVLIATRGSCEKAVNIECTTMGSELCESTGGVVPRRLAARQIFGDFPLSQAEQTQAEGRTKRPQAQGYPGDADRVMHWFSETALADEFEGPTIEDCLQKAMEIKGSRCADLLRDDEIVIESGTDNASTKEDETGTEGVLKAMLQILSHYSVPTEKKKGGNKRRAEIASA